MMARRGWTVVLMAASLALAAAGTAARAADEDGGPPSRMTEARGAIKAKNFNLAINILEGMYREKPKNADVLNLLGYIHRKKGQFDMALEFYKKALAVKPKHKGANEYLGELYLKTDRLKEAEERLAVLDKACFFGCEEYSDLEKAIKEYKKTNGL